jgi:hypothetical protein
MTHIYFCITVLLCLGAIAALTNSPYVTVMFSMLTFAFTLSFIIHYS